MTPAAVRYNPRLPNARPQRVSWIVCVILAGVCLLPLTGCDTPPASPGNATNTSPQAFEPTPAHHLTTQVIDRYEPMLADVAGSKEFDNKTKYVKRLRLYDQRWQAVQLAVAYHGTTHRETFYGSRAYWHTGSTRGLGWSLDVKGDLIDPVFVDAPGNVRVAGDANADIEVNGDAIVHILGDLNATLELKGVCELVVAGNLTENATIICDGQLNLFVGGNSNAVLGATRSATIIIDGNANGVLQCGAPATTLTITGDLIGQIPAPSDKDAVLSLRVDGYTPTEKMLDLATAGFTRVNATLGTSNVPPGLYPQDPNAGARPTARWVVLQQKQAD